MDVVLEDVELEFTATKLTAAAAVSDLTITVETTVELNEEDGGDIRINGVDYTYDSADPETGIVTLNAATPISAAVAADDIVYVIAGDDIGQTWWAVVTIPGSETGEPIPYRIHDRDIDYYKLGDEQAGAVLSIGTDERGRPVVTGRPGQRLSMDLSNGYNVPDPAAVAVDPPAVSPAIISVTGNATGLTVYIEPFAPGVLIDFLIDGVVVAADQRTQVLNLTTDGTDPLALDTDYTVTVVAHNNVDFAPPSVGVTAQLDQGMTAELVTAILVAGGVITGFLQIGGTLLTPAGSTLVGQAILDALIANGNVTINGLTNALNGLLTLGTGVGNPTAMASVTPSGYDSDTLDTPVALTPSGLFDDGVRWVYTASAGSSGNISRVTKGTGATLLISFEPDGMAPLGGIVKVGTSWYVLGKDYNAGRDGDWWVYVYNSSFVKTGEWAPAASAAESLAIGVDGSNLLIAKRTVANNLYVSTYTTGGTESSFVLCGSGWGAITVTGVHKRAVDTATARFVVSSTSSIRVFNTGTGARISGEEWTPASTPINGLGHDGTNWFTFDGTKVWKYTNLVLEADFGYDHADTDAGGAGLARTKISTLRTIKPTKRAKWTVTLPAPPPDDGTVDGANTANIYIAYPSGGTPVLQTALAEGTYSATYSTIATVGTSPSPTNEFAARVGAIGKIESAAVDGSSNPLISLAGDGAARIGPWSSDANGNGTQTATMVTSSANAAPTSTANVTVAGLSVSVTSPHTGAKYAVTLSVDVLLGATGGNVTELLVDGVAQEAIVFAGANLGRSTGSKRYIITGLSAGSHTFTVRTRSQGAYTTTVLTPFSTMAVERIA